MATFTQVNQEKWCWLELPTFTFREALNSSRRMMWANRDVISFKETDVCMAEWSGRCENMKQEKNASSIIFCGMHKRVSGFYDRVSSCPLRPLVVDDIKPSWTWVLLVARVNSSEYEK